MRIRWQCGTQTKGPHDSYKVTLDELRPSQDVRRDIQGYRLRYLVINISSQPVGANCTLRNSACSQNKIESLGLVSQGKLDADFVVFRIYKVEWPRDS